MSKLDELRRAAGANVAESMSKGLVRPAPMHGATAPAAAGPDRWAGLERLPGAQRVPIDRIIRDETQPREVFDEAELAELAASIRARGILQPIRVRWDERLFRPGEGVPRPVRGRAPGIGSGQLIRNGLSPRSGHASDSVISRLT